MHSSAYTAAETFCKKFVIHGMKVLDIGSYDFNGSLRPLFQNCEYVGLDITSGKNVDVIANAHAMPFGNDSFDIIISSSNFEHDELFWLTFKEMCRVVKPGGFIYICAPSAGEYHGYPVDCWRFYKDSATALQKWAAVNFNGNSYKLEIMESSIGTNEPWKDNVSIFKKII